MTVKLDTLEDSDYSEDESGPQITRGGTITGLSGISRERWLWVARTTAGVPAYGDYHPVVPGARVLRLSLRPINADSARLSIVYARPSSADQTPAGGGADPGTDAQISIGATLTQVETQKAADGKPLAVEYAAIERDSAGNAIRIIHPDVGDQLPEGADTSGRTWVEGRQIHAASVDVPQGVLRFTRRENDPPLEKALEYIGRVNSSRIWGGAPRTWLCTGIEGQSDDGGASYVVDYSFAYNPETWDQDIIWIDPETSAPHKGISFTAVNEPRSGVARYELRQRADFARLYLTVPGL